MNLRLGRGVALLILPLSLAACSSGGFGISGFGDKNPDTLDAPGVDLRADGADNLETGHRLVSSGQYELAIRSFNRAAIDRGTVDAEILSGLGTANLGLGRLGQAEKLLRRAVERDATQPEIWNNLGVVLMERGKNADATQIFRKAFALDNGESVSIRDNLRLALEKSENSGTSSDNLNDYKLVRRGSSDYVIRSGL
ncbi:tetratricopeptide repeat protein [Sulfitobacter sp. F26169L]|uniref:tetratricopeptide repeat protein n=1 Tax=Sulfitobacter sp. F26169L TaxID=2996015 RepID=UPI002260E9C7|nr:tetratricopeptide repeat protein [Sulfitobacter sp. F26169L]MCX7567592.1 tetratricopeptide repeat protein [Sulfitobacter sp. F26169L]